MTSEKEEVELEAVVVSADVLVAGEEEEDESKQVVLTQEENAIINTAVNTLGALAMRLGFGGFVGFCSGYAIKKATKVVALTLGVGFVCLQSLQYSGYIEVKWGKIKRDLVKVVDTDGSGTFGIKDIRHYITKVFHVLRYKGPPAAGFGFGLYLGFTEG